MSSSGRLEACHRWYAKMCDGAIFWGCQVVARRSCRWWIHFQLEPFGWLHRSGHKNTPTESWPNMFCHSETVPVRQTMVPLFNPSESIYTWNSLKTLHSQVTLCSWGFTPCTWKTIWAPAAAMVCPRTCHAPKTPQWSRRQKVSPWKVWTVAVRRTWETKTTKTIKNPWNAWGHIKKCSIQHHSTSFNQSTSKFFFSFFV